HPFQMYPNPASKVVHIDYLKEKTVYSIQLIDITGRVIKAFPKDEKILQVADVTRGTYFLLIETREGWVKEKLVLQ
ncbi:MAG TPA: T9SS type A sorting domain-containing protein, partial [Flavipsychrobacter sp.]|nr:T9SS type A sorting domain-containing protein [Flavipsychrobacter sp.]